MLSGRMVKLSLLELLQVAGLSVPVLVVMQRFATLIAQIKRDAQPPDETSTAYWLIVTSSIAYVATVTLLVWVPVKCVLYRRCGLFRERTTWRPVTLMYILLSTLPSFTFLVAGSQFGKGGPVILKTTLHLVAVCLVAMVQIHYGKVYDTFSELSVSLVLLSLIGVDIVERIRPCRLTGPDEFGLDTRFTDPVLLHNDAVPSVSARLSIMEEQIWAESRSRANGSMAALGLGACGVNSPAPHHGPLKYLCVCDTRPEHFVHGFVFWLDTAELLRLASLPSVYLSSWLFPIYVLSYLSSLRVIAAPQSPWLPSLGVWLQDLPFFILRVILIAIFGLITPVLYLLKNVLITLAFIYFNYMTRLAVFNTQHLF